MQHSVERVGWVALCRRLADGYRHPRFQGASIGVWKPAAPRRLVDAALSMAVERVPATFADTRFEPSHYERLATELRSLCDLLDELGRDAGFAPPGVANRAASAPSLVEPFIVKLLAILEPAKLRGVADVAPGLVRLLKLLAESGLSPFDAGLLRLSDADFRNAFGGQNWGTLNWCLWEVLGARHAQAHGAPAHDLETALRLLWSTAVVVLSIAERAMPRLDIAGGRLPPRFRAVRKLGEGGMGVVYEVVDEDIGVRRAMKVLHMTRSDAASARHDVLREAATLEQLNSRRVVRYFGVHTHGEALAIEMALVEGQSLQAELDAIGPMSVEDAVQTTIEVLSALEYVHGERVVHRDVKPANFIRTPEGIVAVDFGLARMLGVDRTCTRRDGSDRFIAPEQLEGVADHRSDLFAAARLLYALLAELPPSHDADPLTMANSQVNDALAAVYLKATRRDVSDRYESAAAMRSALERAISKTAAATTESQRQFETGTTWAGYVLEHALAPPPTRSSCLFRVRHANRALSREKQLWLHVTPTDQEREALARLSAKLLDTESVALQRCDEFIEEPRALRGLDIGILFEEVSSSSLASLLVACSRAGRRIPASAVLFIVRQIVPALCDLVALQRALRRELSAVVGARQLPLTGLHPMRVWPRAVRLSSSGMVKLSVVDLFRAPQDPSGQGIDPALRYAAPEQFTSKEPGDPEAAAAYAVALIAWECLSGSQGFGAQDAQTLARDVCSKRLTTLSSCGVAVHAAFEDATMIALSADASHRPKLADLRALAARLTHSDDGQHELAALMGAVVAPRG